MRIIGGRYKGATLTAPTGDTTRPTLDRGRENLFNILGNAPHIRQLIGGRVLDVFAGSGALGLEAYSRGAKHVTYIEQSKNALSALRANIAKVQAENHSTVMAVDATALPVNTQAPATLAILDAPYHQNLHPKTLERLYSGGWFCTGALVVVQQSPDEPFTLPDWATLVADKTYGKATRFILFSVV